MMDAAPRLFADLPLDTELGVPVPFVCGTEATSARSLDHRRVTQCALSRVCSVCGAGLGRPLTFVGTQAESDANSFLMPPAHLDCAVALRTAYDGVEAAVLGQDEPADFLLVTTGGFEYVRASREDLDRRARFEPNSRL
jgi:hypothetical protein